MGFTKIMAVMRGGRVGDYIRRELYNRTAGQESAFLPAAGGTDDSQPGGPGLQERVECPHTCFPVFPGESKDWKGLGVGSRQRACGPALDLASCGLQSDWLNLAICIEIPLSARPLQSIVGRARADPCRDSTLPTHTPPLRGVYGETRAREPSAILSPHSHRNEDREPAPDQLVLLIFELGNVIVQMGTFGFGGCLLAVTEQQGHARV
jgi:hypothetical protein